MSKYGWSFTAHKSGFMLVVNGWMFSTYVHEGKRKFFFDRNVWRKRGEVLV